MKSWSVIPLMLLGFLLSCSTCTVAAEDTALSLIKISGGNSILSLDGSGSYQCLLKDVSPNSTITTDNNTSSVRIEEVLPTATSTAAIVLGGIYHNDTVIMARLSGPEYSTEKKTLSWSVIPQQFYDGTLLKEFSANRSDLKPGRYGPTSVHLEYEIPVVNNTR